MFCFTLLGSKPGVVISCDHAQATWKKFLMFSRRSRVFRARGGSVPARDLTFCMSLIAWELALDCAESPFGPVAAWKPCEVEIAKYFVAAVEALRARGGCGACGVELAKSCLCPATSFPALLRRIVRSAHETSVSRVFASSALF